MRARGSAGMTLIEIMIAVAILAVIIVISLSALVTVQRATIDNTDKSFAVQKAISILSELRGLVESTSGASASLLDGYDDGVGSQPMLTISPAALNPDDPVSGNFLSNGAWQYQRRITVRRFASLDARDVRIVTVRVFRSTPTNPTETLLADITSVIRTVGDIYPPTQVYDLYVLAIENIPGWWVHMSNLKPFIENSLADLQARNPGLTFRLHWITKAAYGRDSEYRPYVNRAGDSVADINSVYFYPGTLPLGSAVGEYYVPTIMTGLHSQDGVTTNGYDAVANPTPFAYADMWNNAMRYRDEEALFAQRVASGQEKAEEPTLRILLERMNRTPAQYRNVIFMNLHGELLPMPPIRNYADAAKDPPLYPQWRVVAHPEMLRVPHANSLQYRIYAYLDDPALSVDNLMEQAGADVPISFRVRDANLTAPGDVTVTAFEGGFDQDGVPGTDNYTSGAGLTAPVANRQYYTTSTYVDVAGVRWTEFRFFNTPLRTPVRVNTGTTPDSITGGLPTGANLPDGTATINWRLYNRDYIPAPVEAANSFLVNLTTAGNRPKNTARWMVRIAPAALDREFGAGVTTELVTETRIGTNLLTGQTYPARIAPHNLSKTYCWRTNDVNDVPFTERYQVMGDPRHCPYADVKAGGASFPNAYNWYFDNFRSAAANRLGAGMWEGWDAARIRNGVHNQDGWHGNNAAVNDAFELDVPRQFQLLRGALQETGAVWTTLTGFSYYYMGIGGEIGYDAANGFPNSIPVSSRPFTGAGGTRFEDSITDATIFGNPGGVKYIRENVGGNYWWGAHWLGELCPDTAYPQWVASGNLLTGVGAGRFVRVLRSQIPVTRCPSGTDFTAWTVVRRTNVRGCTSFFNNGNAGSVFRHNFNGGQDGSLGPAGTELGNNYNFALPTTTKISRPYKPNYGPAFGLPDEFGFAEYAAKNSASNAQRFYGHSSDPTAEGSGIIHMDNSAASRRAFVVISGLDTTTESGTGFIAKMSTLSLIHTFLDSGRPALTQRITELPRLTVDSPTNVTELLNPATITVNWSIQWRRWDNLPYTSGYPAVFAENEAELLYARLYSADNGATWRHMSDNTPAVPGNIAPAYLVPDAGTGVGEAFVWDVSDTAAFPEASYLIRVECYRGSNLTNHYSQHQQKIFIDR